jgi:hypothetical protein
MKKSSQKAPESVKSHVENRANQLIETFLKPTFIQPPPEEPRFNYLVDITSKWYRNYFYFCCRYCSPGPNAISPYFEDKFARLEYTGHDRFNLAFMRHTGQWQELYQGLTLDECLQAIQEEPFFQP